MNENEIPFIQYLRPDGRKFPVYFEAPPEVLAKAKKILAAGFLFEIEVLTTGEVSMTVSDPEAEEDIAIQICANGPGIEQYVEKLVNEAVELIERSPVR